MPKTAAGLDETFTIVMPVYNEEECIEEVLRSWSMVLKRYPGSELLVLNDGSTDRTAEILERIGDDNPLIRVINKKNEGHGKTIYTGYAEAVRSGHGWVFQTDSDGQIAPTDFPALWNARSESDLVLGFRKYRNDPAHRLVLTRIMSPMIYCLFGISLKDANVPFRLMRREYLETLLVKIPPGTFAPNVFLSILAARDDLDLQDIPVTHIKRKTGKESLVNVKLVKGGLRIAKELIAFRMVIFSLDEKHV